MLLLCSSLVASHGWLEMIRTENPSSVKIYHIKVVKFLQDYKEHNRERRNKKTICIRKRKWIPLLLAK